MPEIETPDKFKINEVFWLSDKEAQELAAEMDKELKTVDNILQLAENIGIRKLGKEGLKVHFWSLLVFDLMQRERSTESMVMTTPDDLLKALELIEKQKKSRTPQS